MNLTPSPEVNIEQITTRERADALFDLMLSKSPIEHGWLLTEIKMTMGKDIKPDGVIGEAKWKKVTVI